jgi:two-component system phosphate regulon sensor histidine kinase PhoR
MPEPVSSGAVRRLIAWAVGPSIPGWAVLGGLALGGLLSWYVALIAAVILFGLMALLVLARLADFDRLIRYAEESFNNPDARPPTLNTSATAQRLLAALTALRRLWAERRDEATALAKSRQDILDTLPDPLFLVDTRRRVISANASARDLFEVGSAAPRLLGRDLASVIRDPKILEAADQALAQGKKTEAQFTLPAPVERTFGVLMVPLDHAGQDGTALIVALHDQTERLKTDRMRADFVANASHELRTPLAAVLGFIETLQGPAKDDEKARGEFLEIMLKQAQRMTRLIDDLLSLSRIELREHTRPTEAVNIATVVQTTVELLQPKAKERRASVNVQLAGLPAALGDSSELSQVFHNLISNALKYGGDGGQVDVVGEVSETRPPSMPGRGDCLKISVRDYGEGIPREHLPRLTERFYRIDTARSRSLGGTGLGLAIVKHIVLRHRGALTIASEIGIGSTFTIYLPLAPATAATLKQAS